MTVYIQCRMLKFSTRVDIDPTNKTSDYLCSILLSEYQNYFPGVELPMINHMMNSTRRKNIALSSPVCHSFASGDHCLVDCRDYIPSCSTTVEEAQNRMYVFRVAFHSSNQYGFRLMHDGSQTRIAKIKQDTAAAFYPRLIPGTAIIQINQIHVTGWTKSKVRAVLDHEAPPVIITFRGTAGPIDLASRHDHQGDAQSALEYTVNTEEDENQNGNNQHTTVCSTIDERRVLSPTGQIVRNLV